MSEVKYSLTTLLGDLLKLQNNGYEIISKLSDVVSSNADTVLIDIEDANGTVQQVAVPSFGSIKNQLVRIENDVKSLAGIGDTDAQVQLADGSFRKILVSNLQKEASDITSIEVPKEFGTRENWFFESFLNPLLYVKYDLTNQIKFNTERVEVARYILNLDTEDKIKVFNDNFANQSNINYTTFVRVLLDNGITYFLDKDVVDLPPRTLKFFGDFAVTRVFDDTITEEIDGVSVQKRVLRAKLDKLTYNDRDSEYKGTQSLKIGDSLVVNSGRKNTRYEITSIDQPTRTVSLKLIEGFDPITIGAASLLFYDEDESSVSVDINIGFNEYCVVFIKGIDPDSKIAAINWSPGSGIYTNDLTTRDENDELITLSQYYQNQVVDFGSYIYSLAKEKITPAAYGIEPNFPVISDTDFEVVQINQHLTDASSLSDLKSLQEDKIRVQSQIRTLDKSISDLRTKIQTTRYATKRLEEADKGELNRLIEEKKSQSSLFASIIEDINAIGQSESLENLKPKYRVRGFFPIPEAKTSERTGNQEIVQFEIQYRYLKKDGAANKPEQIPFTDTNGEERRGTFSTWVSIKSDVRKRVTDPITGQMSWAVENVEDADAVNINQIDIPISGGETVEFRVRSLSEAGWPISPATSPWSSSISIDFPDELESTADAESILEEAKRQQVLVDVQTEITSLGIPKHVANQFEANGKFFAHSSLEIASGFLTNEQNIISLFDKLVSIDNEVARLRAAVESTRGVLNIRVVDEQGTEYEVQPNSTIKLFAGNYREEVASFTPKKGVIVTKNYFIKISNTQASNLELYARFWGDKYTKSPASWNDGSTYNLNDEDYNIIRRYDYVPIGFSNPDTADSAIYGFIRSTPEQSAQIRGQFIQSRYLSVDGKTPLYGEVQGSVAPEVANSRDQILGNPFSPATSLDDVEEYYSDLFVGTAAGSTAGGDFVWRGSTTTIPTIEVTPWSDTSVSDPTNGYPSKILIHYLHPEIQNWIQEANPNVAAKAAIRNSVFANQKDGNSGSTLQTPLFYEGTGSTADGYSKIAFDPNDQYLLGPKSCGAYLFLNPSNSDTIRVEGNDSLSFKTVEFGANNSLSVPFTFQYRMTDFFGEGLNGLGNVGGDPNSNSTTNLTYKKKLGIDIFSNPINKDKFSFDIEVSARYYSRSITTKDIPSRTFEIALDDLNQTIKNVRPNVPRDAASGSPDVASI